MADANTIVSESSTETIPLEKMSPAQRAEWQLSGEAPKAEPVETPSKKNSETPSETSSSSESTSKSASASEAAASQDTTLSDPDAAMGPKAQKRIKQLLSKVRELESKLTITPSTPTPTPETTTSPAAAAPPKTETSGLIQPKADDHNADGSPKYKTYEEFMDAMIDYRVEKRLQANDQKVTQTEEQRKIAEINTAIENSWKARMEAAKEKHSDWEAKALDPKLPIPSGSQIHSFILDSELGAEIAYYLADHRDELDEMNAIPKHQGWRVARKLVEIEKSLSGSTSPTPPPVSSQTSKAPRPVSEVGGRGTQPADEEVSAVNRADFASFAKAANRRETAPLRKG